MDKVLLEMVMLIDQCVLSYVRINECGVRNHSITAANKQHMASNSEVYYRDNTRKCQECTVTEVWCDSMKSRGI